jgi:hypothetical protein
MSSYFDEASLVMIPSGYKDQKVYSVKPLDGSGDLTFSRASSATRVASNGLIEKVRTNLLLQSNTFNTTWTLDDATLTSGQSGYDGTNNAWRLAKTAAGGRVQQTLSLSSNSHTFSVYLKAGTKNWVFLRADGTSNRTSYFDLQNGVVGTASGCTPSIVSAGNGWYRCSISYVDTTTSARIWVADADGDISGTSGNILIQSAQVETGDIATDYIATTTAAVSVGPVSGLPRLDYLNSTCPRLLLEPQRSNLATWSEQADQYTKANATIGSNVLASPDGYTNADSLIEDTTNGAHAFFNFGLTTFSVQSYTASVFAKKGSRDWFALQMYWNTNVLAYFNLNTGVVGTVTAGATATITPYGNGWYRCTITATAEANVGGIAIYAANADNSISYAGTNGLTAGYFYGWQLEAGAYATSYIPTLGTSVTRVADAASKTGISSLIGQTEGTLFVEAANLFTSGSRTIALLYTSGSAFYQIYINSSNEVRVDVNGSFIFLGGSIAANTKYKIAFAYKSGQYALYINGTQIATSTSTTMPSSLTDYYLGNSLGSEQSGAYSQALLFKTRLSNSDLATLTTL